MIWILPTFYLIVHSSGTDSARSYDGQTQNVILQNLANEGRTGDFIDKAAFDDFVSSHTVQHQLDPQRQALKAQARLDAKNATLTIPQRLQALLILLDYDL